MKDSVHKPRASRITKLKQRSAEMSSVEVNLLGQKYTIRGAGSEEYIKRLADYVDKKMKEVYDINPDISPLRASLLTSLNIVDEITVDAERTKNEYMQNVAHQLAAPINAIKMNLEALHDSRVSIERKKVLMRSTYAQGTVLAHLIKNFSLMSHLDADHDLSGFREEPEDVDLFKLCINLSNDFQPVGRYRGQSIYVDEDAYKKAKYPHVFVIKNLFAQVIYNLLENATKYGDSDSEVVIGLQKKSAMLGPTVRSIGVPISEADFEHIFDRGVRGNTARRLHPAGTGFGLYIARRIMEILGGSLTVATHGKETSFIVRCPLKAE